MGGIRPQLHAILWRDPQGLEADWSFLLLMVRDYFENGGVIDPVFARRRSGAGRTGNLGDHKGTPTVEQRRAHCGAVRQARQAMLLEFLRRHTPLAKYVIRNTRTLLREYECRGLLGADHVPYRKPEQAGFR
jgi:hypothetical protein